MIYRYILLYLIYIMINDHKCLAGDSWEMMPLASWNDEAWPEALAYAAQQLVETRKMTKRRKLDYWHAAGNSNSNHQGDYFFSKGWRIALYRPWFATILGGETPSQSMYDRDTLWVRLSCFQPRIIDLYYHGAHYLKLMKTLGIWPITTIFYKHVQTQKHISIQFCVLFQGMQD